MSKYLVLLGLCLGTAGSAFGATLAEAQKLYDSGKYADCITMCEQMVSGQSVPGVFIPLQIVATPAGEGWWLLKAQAELQLGKYEEADKTTGGRLAVNQENLPLALLRYQALQMSGKAAEAKALSQNVQNMVLRNAWHFYDPENRVAVGQFMLIKGTDARQVLENYYDKALADDPRFLPALMATANLALAKNDPGVASDSFENARKVAPDNPDVYLGLARANEDDPELATAAINKALELNPNHVESLLFVTDNLIDRNDYKAAGETIEKVLAVNPKEPRAWAYRAVMAHLNGDHVQEEAHRAKALGTWASNPEVDYLIGRKLSQNYRFEVGVSYQNKALAFDPAYEPSRFQLGQDYLRMGREEEGWKLADEAFKRDPYNVMAYNLVTLHDRLVKFTTISNDHFVLRMDPKEAPIYGQRVMDLLEKARTQFIAKYNVQLAEPTIIEIFSLQQDFEIRTFGFPGQEGYLGVCFGRVVTVNSPASRLAHPTSWEAVVWHEFCHTVTLTKTRNKMPRWISEGISVYEERLANSAWGGQMLPTYREFIIKEKASKIGELSQAFSRPPTPVHLQFAYYEASMVVEYFISRFGIDALRAVLVDLGNDVMIDQALAKHSVPMDKLEADFATWFRDKARQLAPKVNWDEPKLLVEDGSAPLAAWNKEHPDSFWGLVFEGQALLLERKFAEAKVPLNKALELFPNYTEIDGPLLLLAKAHRELNEAKQEQEVLTKFAGLNVDAVGPQLRLLELAAASKDWKTLRSGAERVLGVDPLTSRPYRYLAEAAEALGDRPTAISSRKTLLMLDPLDKPEQRYRLAKLMFEEGKLAEARKEVVRSLEDAPRYRQALALLLEISAKMDVAPVVPASAPATPAPAGETPARVGQ